MRCCIDRLSWQDLSGCSRGRDIKGVSSVSNLPDSKCRKKSLLNARERNEVLDRLTSVWLDSQRRWGAMSGLLPSRAREVSTIPTESRRSRWNPGRAWPTLGLVGVDARGLDVILPLQIEPATNNPTARAMPAITRSTTTMISRCVELLSEILNMCSSSCA